jgi:hypothetical protein
VANVTVIQEKVLNRGDFVETWGVGGSVANTGLGRLFCMRRSQIQVLTIALGIKTGVARQAVGSRGYIELLLLLLLKYFIFVAFYRKNI